MGELLPHHPGEHDRPRRSRLARPALIAAQLFGGWMDEREHAIATYEANVAAALAGRLLVHQLGDGWAPLCAHLGVPMP